MTLIAPTSLLKAAVVMIATGLAAFSAHAQAVVATGESFISSRLLPGQVTPDGGRLAGLRLSLEPGWKTYWRTPGETGIPPSFDWSGSQNVQKVQLRWPRPMLFESFGMRTAGYAEVVLFPLEVTPIDASRPMRLALSADLGVCKEICVLETVTINLDIAPDDAAVGARQIRSAMRRVPVKATADQVRLDVCDISGRGRDRDLTLSLSLADDLTNAVVLLENEQGLWIRHMTQSKTEVGVRLDAEVRLPKDLSWIDRSAFRMTVLSEFAAYELRGCETG